MIYDYLLESMNQLDPIQSFRTLLATIVHPHQAEKVFSTVEAVLQKNADQKSESDLRAVLALGRITKTVYRKSIWEGDPDDEVEAEMDLNSLKLMAEKELTRRKNNLS